MLTGSKQKKMKTDLDELKLFTEWHSGFALFVIASPTDTETVYGKPLLTTHDMISEHLGFEISFIRPSVSTPLSDIVTSIVAHSHTRRALWLELCFDPAIHKEGYDVWLTMIHNLLSILNKSRSQLEKMLNAPLFLHFDSNKEEGAHFSSLMVTYAPDLWTIRQMTISPN